MNQAGTRDIGDGNCPDENKKMFAVPCDAARNGKRNPGGCF